MTPLFALLLAMQPTVDATNLSWRSRPNAEDMARLYPQRAAEAELGGYTLTRCRLGGDGVPRDCIILAESPTNSGFGEASLRLAERFRTDPRTASGESVEGADFVIPIRWTLNGRGANEPLQLTLTPAWRAAPSRDQLRVAPARLAVVRCAIRADDGLDGCRPASEEPQGQGLGRAALTLSEAFRVAGDDTLVARTSGAVIEYRVRFGGPATEFVTNPRWLRRPTAEEISAAFDALANPAEPRAVGAIVECDIHSDGALADCRALQATSVEAANAATGLAGRFAISPWSAEGSSWVGARIRLPLRR